VTETLYDRLQRERAERTAEGEPVWLDAADVPEWPPDPTVFGPPLVADPTNFHRDKSN